MDKDEAVNVTGFGLPFEDVAGILAAAPGGKPGKDADEALQLLTRGPFGFTAILELGFNKDAYTGREIKSTTEVSYFQDGRDWEVAPGWLKKLVGYRPATRGSVAVVDPHIAWMLGKTPLSRFFDVTERVYTMTDDERAQINLFTLSRTLLGPRVNVVNKKTQKYYVNKGRIEAMRSFLASIGSIRKYETFSDVDEHDQDYKSRSRRRRTTRR